MLPNKLIIPKTSFALADRYACSRPLPASFGGAQVRVFDDRVYVMVQAQGIFDDRVYSTTGYMNHFSLLIPLVSLPFLIIHSKAGFPLFPYLYSRTLFKHGPTHWDPAHAAKRQARSLKQTIRSVSIISIFEFSI